MNKTIIRLGAAMGALLVALPVMAQDLTFWSWRQEDRAQYEQFIDTFEAANPGITVKFETFEAANYNTILSTALAGGTGPDLMMVRAYGGMENVASAGYLEPLTVEAIPALADFAPSALAAETMRSDQTLYAVPFASQTQLVIYNKGIFDANGITEPQTWDELIAASQKLKDAGIMPFANGTATAWQNETIVGDLVSSIMGKGFYDDLIAGKADFTDPRYVEALAKLKEISAYFPDGFIGLDYPSAQQLFSSGMAAMFAGGSYELATFKTQNPDIELGVFAAPGKTAEDEKLVAIYYDGGYAANAHGANKEAALKFLNYVASLEFGQAFANTLNNISTVPGVTFENPLLAEIAELNTSAIPYLMLVHFRYGEPSGSVLLQAEVQKLLAGQTTPEAAGAAVTEGLKAWYEPFQK
ncbi:sugar ABC transporter substrate-binding protein [Devosia limi DSM 17137]|uniref:Raffinose/stachyose/melibiose transport system substrate-binding protein n=1 Tax=Devosia limi DSM 17137 TaxID=1121477 RepID=A0A0F5LU04_9HYPH|nr:extracellular solute-binding protein [Devosia limi]KKB85127.1 sugar ABC transporter substrate-binding protein [Devosia limi DSM 17137]SHF78366.1 raffinose/stachyose/melibiose transport system substrate-binding protein [Devosia limi DSM 17137]